MLNILLPDNVLLIIFFFPLR